MGLKALPTPLQQGLQLIVKQIFGSHALVREARLLNQHEGYWVVVLQVAHPTREVSIKLATPDAGRIAAFERSAALHELVARHTAIPMAQVLGMDTTFRTVPWTYVVKSYVRGVEWAALYAELDNQQRASAFRQLGQVIAELHSVTLPAFGELEAPEPPQSFYEALRARVQRMIRNPTLQDYFLTTLADHHSLFSTIHDPRLCHDDLHHYNILFHQIEGVWTLATILDFDKAWAGHAESDLARMDLWVHMMHPAFRDVYHAVHPPDPLYEQRRALYQLQWCLEYPNTDAKHRADTERVCQELDIPTPPWDAA